MRSTAIPKTFADLEHTLVRCSMCYKLALCHEACLGPVEAGGCLPIPSSPLIEVNGARVGRLDGRRYCCAVSTDVAPMVPHTMNSAPAMQLRFARLAVAALAVLIADHEGAASGRGARAVEVIAREPGEPVIAVVSLLRQRIAVYDAEGWILRAPVSSGQRGRETPARCLQRDPEECRALLQPL